MRKPQFLFILLVSAVSRNWGQSIDSLYSLIHSETNTVERVDAINLLAFELRLSDPDSTIVLAELSKSLSTQLDYQKGLGDALMREGIGYTYLGDYYVALDRLLKAEDIYQENLLYAGLAACANNIGRLYNELNEYDLALKYYNQSAINFWKIREYKKQGIILGNIGYLYKLNNEYDSAQKYLSRALNIAYKHGDELGVAYPLYNLGSLYLVQDKLDSAGHYLTKSMSIAKSEHDDYLLCLNLLDLGKLALANEGVLEAHSYFLFAYDVAERTHLTNEIKEAAKLLAISYEELDSVSNALEFFRKYSIIKDTLLNNENTRKLALLEANYNHSKERVKLEHIQQQAMAKSNWIRNTFIGGFIIMSLISYLLYRSKEQRRKINKELNKLNKTINEQNEELLQQSELLIKSNDEISRINSNLEQLVQDRTKKIQLQNQKLLNFLNYNSHKIRGPLARILGLVNLINQDGIDKKDRKETFRLLNIEAEQLDKMVNDVTRNLESDLD